jgi:hypothetical protein
MIFDFRGMITSLLPGLTPRSKGSSVTPPHMQRDFKFADYAPLVFARIREAFGIDPADYLVRKCSH